MPLMPLKRKFETKITGLQYDAENMYEIIQLYAQKGMTVVVDPNDMGILFSNGRDDGTVECKVGYWVVCEGNQKYIVSQQDFQDNYVITTVPNMSIYYPQQEGT